MTLRQTSHKSNSIPSYILQAVDSSVWDQVLPGRAINAQPLRISLSPELAYTNKAQYPTKLEVKKGLQPLVDKILSTAPWCPSNLCATLILPIVKPEGEYRVVQDLTVVVHIQPLLANHNILTQIPEDTTRVRVRSLVVSSGIWVNML